MKSRKYTETQLVEAVQESFSIRQVLTKLGLVEAGGNYAVVKRFIEQLGLDTSHFLGQSWRKKNRIPVVASKDIKDLLQKGSQCQSYKLKAKILKSGLKSHQCEQCQFSRWLERPIPLELHHCNGDVTDNRLENLQLLCPNCHALTANYRGRKLAKCRDETAPA